MHNHIKEFVKEIKTFHRHNKWQVFSDFCELAACSFSNSVNIGEAWQRREDQYMRAIKPYTKEEACQFAKLLSIVVEALELEPQDFLGSVFMELELSNHWKGQYFTPYHVSKLMAEVTYDESVSDKITENGFITLSEPACGAGSMVIAFAETMRAREINYQRHLHVTCVDVDATAAYMAYIQLTLLHIPAVVIVGNTLSLEIRDKLYTPAHVLGLWSAKLEARAGASTGLPQPMPQPAPKMLCTAPQALSAQGTGLQISLFD